MAIKDWPRLLRRAVAWALMILAFAIAFVPSTLLVLGARVTLAESLTWSRLLGGYALVITVPTTLIVAAFVAVQFQRERRSTFGFAVLMGTTVGIVVGLVLGLVTGGYSLLSAPAVGLLTFVAAWAFQSKKADDAGPSATPR